MRWYSRKTHLRGASEPSCGFEKFPSFCRTCDKTCNKAEFLFMALYRCRCGFHTGSPIYKRPELTKPLLKTLHNNQATHYDYEGGTQCILCLTQTGMAKRWQKEVPSQPTCALRRWWRRLLPWHQRHKGLWRPPCEPRFSPSLDLVKDQAQLVSCLVSWRARRHWWSAYHLQRELVIYIMQDLVGKKRWALCGPCSFCKRARSTRLL